MLYMCGTVMLRWPVGDMKHMLVSALVTADRMDVGRRSDSTLHVTKTMRTTLDSETGF